MEYTIIKQEHYYWFYHDRVGWSEVSGIPFQILINFGGDTLWLYVPLKIGEMFDHLSHVCSTI